MKIINIFGTRPEIIKFQPFIKSLHQNKINYENIYGGQHYSKNLSKVFFNDKFFKKPKYYFNYGSKFKNLNYIRELKEKIFKILIKEKPDFVFVQGDTNTTLAGSLSTLQYKKKINKNINLCHIEAGLRSKDLKMQEELNRIIIDHISDLLFAPTNLQKKNLTKENINKNKIFIVGNTLSDVLKNIKIKKKKIKQVILTMHRDENVKKKKDLSRSVTFINLIASQNNEKINFFCHPKTKQSIVKYNLSLRPNIKLEKPTNYSKFINSLFNSKYIISDSGGIQEEACILKKHLITLRYNTERPETISIGSNILSNFNYLRVKKRINYINKTLPRWKSPYGINVSKKIIDIISKNKKRSDEFDKHRLNNLLKTFKKQKAFSQKSIKKNIYNLLKLLS